MPSFLSIAHKRADCGSISIIYVYSTCFSAGQVSLNIDKLSKTIQAQKRMLQGAPKKDHFSDGLFLYINARCYLFCADRSQRA